MVAVLHQLLHVYFRFGSVASFRGTREMLLDVVTWWPNHSYTKLGTNGRYLIRAAD